MRHPFASIAVMLVCALIAAPSRADARVLTFEDRVKAQAAIERVYYSHQLGAAKSFEEAVPRRVLEEQVRLYLRQSIALQNLWHTTVTAEMLQEESERIASDTRMPERLRELYAAAGNDPFVFQETIARASLVDRLARNFLAHDDRFQESARREADEIRRGLAEGWIDPWAEGPRSWVTEVVQDTAGRSAGEHGAPESDPSKAGVHHLRLDADAFHRLRSAAAASLGRPGPVTDDGDAFVVHVVLSQEPERFRLASFKVPKLAWDEWWRNAGQDVDVGGVKTVARGGGRLPIPSGKWTGTWDPGQGLLPESESINPASSASCTDNTWIDGALAQRIDPRQLHSAVWTGSVMIVWGGEAWSLLNTGGRYDPATDTWKPTSTVGAPSPRIGQIAVWTGNVMMIWGGGLGTFGSNVNTGGRYNPVTDSWQPVSTVGAPSARSAQAAVWTGSRAVVWGGMDNAGVVVNTGGRYDPVTDSWTSTSTVNAPPARSGYTAVWTGTLMIVWGGGDYIPVDGGRYNSGTDSWTPMSELNAPSYRVGQAAVWTGKEMIVWGGDGGGITGGRYNPTTDVWLPTSTINTPASDYSHIGAWSGSEMIIWERSGGGAYNPTTDTWRTMSLVNGPSSRISFTAIWAGSRLIVWGGYDTGGVLNTGGRYDPSSDTWTPTDASAPPARSQHATVWTGSLMLVWGNGAPGWKYDPSIDSWAPIPITDAPEDRGNPSAIWTGNQMIVWGGQTSQYPYYLASGGRYEPISQTWLPVSTLGAPEGRIGHTAVWTGTQMIVWGGTGSTKLGTGGRYDPQSDTWSPTSNLNAPVPRVGHTAVWTGTLMVIWGGTGSYILLNAGERYDPVSDTWSPVNSSGQATGRYGHTAVWTGDEMIVWGGFNGEGSVPPILNTGGIYNPATDTWRGMSVLNAPEARGHHTSIWTGSFMMVWGGFANGAYLNSGGRFDPSSNSWTATATSGAPTGRTDHSTVWSGQTMIVWGGNNGGYLNTGGQLCVCNKSTFFQDADGDGSGNQSVSIQACPMPAGYVVNGTDCNDSSAAIWATPSEVPNLSFTSKTLLSWTPPASPGGTNDLYDLLRSTVASDFMTSATCVVSNATVRSASDSTVPTIGHALYYLVRAENACPNGQGLLGTDSNSVPRSGRACP